MKYFSFAIIGIVAATSIAAFLIIGSPVNERVRKLDIQRVSDLTALQYQVISYWQSKEQLPNALSDVNDSISGFRAPRDPETYREYEYEKKGEKTFSLCAVFSKASEGDTGTTYAPVSEPLMRPVPAPSVWPKGNGRDGQWNWAHSVGRVCFERTIDADVYPLFKKKT